MVQSNRVRAVALLALCALASCDGCGDDESCTVKQLDAGMSIVCGDGTEAPLPAPCSVEEVEEGIVVSCSDGTEVTIPSGDAGAGSCSVSKNEDGSLTVSCPDGSTVIIPAPGQDGGAADGGPGPTQDGGLDASTLPLIVYTGAIATTCGGCHDDQANQTHFASQTTMVNGKPVEDCVTCHQAGGLRPVSQVHARLELGPPGFKVQILEAGIDPVTRQVTVNLRVQDGDGGALSLSGVSSNFLIATVPTEQPVGGGPLVAGPYVNYFTSAKTQVDNPDFPLEGAPPRVVQQPFADNKGTFGDGGAPGMYTYTFEAGLPADYDGGLTHVVSTYSTRSVAAGVTAVSNSSLFFVPANPAAVPLQRKVVHTATCNSCHNPLSFHGGSRQELDVCLSCHSQGSSDPESGNSIDLNVMIHRIHMGKDLPSVKAGGSYKIVGRNNTTEDFSEVGYPRDIVQCQSCHTDTDDTRWYTNGKREVCMSCHENVYDPGEHPFMLAPNDVCGNANCHGNPARDALAKHKTFLNSNTLIFDIAILSATVANADSAPALKVRALTGPRLSGATIPVTSADSLSTLVVFLNGPNTDYASNGHNIKFYQKPALVGLTASSTPGEFTFSLPETLRVAVGSKADPAKDSFTLSIRAAYDPTPNAAPDTDRVDMQKNPTIAIAVAGTPVPRVAVVDTAKCNNCHGNLSFHIGSPFMARNADQCVMCHTATIDTTVPQGGNREPGPTKSVRFSKLIHRIHAGGMATQPYVLYNNAPMPPYPLLDFTDIGFPGDRRDCNSCHISGSDPTFDVPLQASTAPTETHILDGTGKPITQ